MVKEAIKCPSCAEASQVKRHGKTNRGAQRYRCHGCKKSFLTDYAYEGHKPEVKRLISQMAMNGSGVRDTSRVLGVPEHGDKPF